jgi:hypothetical protein
MVRTAERGLVMVYPVAQVVMVWIQGNIIRYSRKGNGYKVSSRTEAGWFPANGFRIRVRMAGRH